MKFKNEVHNVCFSLPVCAMQAFGHYSEQSCYLMTHCVGRCVMISVNFVRKLRANCIFMIPKRLLSNNETKMFLMLIRINKIWLK